MDWTKAKTIIIIALIATNIFLVFTYGFNRFGKNSEIPEDVLIKVLSNNNIELAAEIPKVKDKMPVLYIEYSAFNKEKIRSLIKDGKYKVSKGAAPDELLVDIADMFLADSGLLNENVAFESVENKGKGKLVKYRNEMKGIVVEESYIYCYFEAGELISVESYWLEPENFSKKKMDIISAADALVIFMSELPRKEEKILIEDIELVYWLDNSSFDGEELVADTALPAWKIVYNGAQKKHIYAYEQ